MSGIWSARQREDEWVSYPSVARTACDTDCNVASPMTETVGDRCNAELDEVQSLAWPKPSGLPAESQSVSVSPVGAPISKEELLAYRKRLFAKLDEVLLAKGNDYNSAQQNAGDTLFNLRTCSILGIVPCPEDGILVRLSDKLMRLVSLTRPGTVQKVKDESIDDTGGDAINYITYLLAMRAKRAGKI